MIVSPAGLTLLALAPLLQTRETVREERPDGCVAEYEVREASDGSTVRHGSYLETYPNGRVHVRGEYEEGQREGKWRWSFDDGSLQERGRYRAGKRDGKWFSKHPNSEDRAEGSYTRGWRDGPWEFFTAEGEPDPVNSGEYRHEAGTLEALDIDFEGELLDGARHGAWTFHWPNGTRLLAGDYVRGTPRAGWRFWHEDGTLDPAGWPVEESAAPGPGAESAPRSEEWMLSDPRTPAWLPPLSESAREDGSLALDAFPRLVEELVRLDTGTEAGQARGAEIAGMLLPQLCRGLGFGWAEGTGAQAAEANRISALRWHSLWALAADDEVFWTHELLLSDSTEVRPRPPLPWWRGGDSEPRPPAPRAPAEEAHQAALNWLAAHQDASGLWSGAHFGSHCPEDDACDGVVSAAYDVGLSGLCLLAMLEAGSDMNTGAYRDNVRRGVFAILRTMDPKSGALGNRRVYENHYNHFIATLVLCTALPSRPTAILARRAQRAVDYVLRARNLYGGWRYDYPPTGETDTSVTTWAVQALAAAERVGLVVEPAAFDDGLSAIDEVTDTASGRIGYDQLGSTSSRTPENEHFPRERSEAMTAAGLYARMLLSERRGGAPSPLWKKHADLLLTRLPEWDPESFGCDLYYWHYGTRAMRRMGERNWKKWRAALESALLPAQRQKGHSAGSLDPAGPWGVSGGRVYSTAMFALMLGELASGE